MAYNKEDTYNPDLVSPPISEVQRLQREVEILKEKVNTQTLRIDALISTFEHKLKLFESSIQIHQEGLFQAIRDLDERTSHLKPQ